MENKEQEPKAPLGTRWLFYLWLLLFVSVIAVCLGFAPNRERFWLWWEVGTLGTATLYTALFYVRLFWRTGPDTPALYKELRESVIGVIPIPCLAAVVALAAATAFSSGLLDDYLWIKPHTASVIAVVIAAICFCVIDSLFGFCHTSAEVRHEFRQGLFLNGLPVFIAFAILLIFVAQFDSHARWDVPLKSFVGGAIAFEMLVSNTVFAVLFYKPREL